MPFHEVKEGSLLDKVNKEPCLVKFLDLPITYQNQDLDLIIDYFPVDKLPNDLRQWTFSLVESNLRKTYETSKSGWNSEEKQKEMLDPQTHYLIARSKHDPKDRKGFLSFQMVQEETVDDDIMINCAYCYEIQLIKEARGRGLGECLMNLLSHIGTYWKMDKVMLTVYKANTGAFKFYNEKLGFELDEISPGAYLSYAQAKSFDYEILSKLCG